MSKQQRGSIRISSEKNIIILPLKESPWRKFNGENERFLTTRYAKKSVRMHAFDAILE